MLRKINLITNSLPILSLVTASFFFANLAAKADEAGPVIDCMEKELLRNFKILKKAEYPAYFIAYRLYDKESMDVVAAGGSISKLVPYRHQAYASVEVRVGDYKLDSSHRLVNDERDQAEQTLGAFGVVPLDAGKSLRSVFWLETEKQYRVATQRYGKVLAQRGLKTDEDDCPDFSKEKSYTSLSKTDVVPIDFEPFKQAAKKLSLIFSRYPEIEQSWSEFKVSRTRRYIVNSELSAVKDKSSIVNFYFGASGTAKDGEKIERYQSIYFANPEDLVLREASLEKSVTQLASSIEGYIKAPLAEPYCGPVILRGSAAAVLFHEVLGHRLEASRHRENSDGKTFTKMLGKKILPTFISLYDRPTLPKIDDVDLNGHYLVDDDGVPAQDVTLVKNGILSNFLTARSPTPTSPASNGHGRCGDSSTAMPASRMANLIVESTRTVSEDKLRQLLIEEVKKQGKPYGLIIEQADSGETDTSSYRPQVFQIRPSIVKRIYADGRPDELIRGVRIIGTPMAALQHIVMTADKTQVFNGYCGAESGWVPQANCCPSLLLDSLEIERETPSRGIARILPPPPTDAAGGGQ